MKVLITGATGLVGRAVCGMLTADGHAIVALSRSPDKVRDLQADQLEAWDPMSGPLPGELLAGAGAVIHLAGEPIIARRWTDDQKRLIRDSRVTGTRNVVAGIEASTHKPGVLVCASAVGYYGERGDEPLEESSPPGEGFLSDTCKDWEQAVASLSGVRSVQIRTGVVLATEGGALQKMLTPFKLGVGGPLGSGRQWFPWVHIKDIAGLFRHAMVTASLRGPVNGVAPEPVTNAEFTRALGAVLHRPAFLPVPEFALRALMGEMADVLFVSQRVLPTAALASGYEFHYPLLQGALAQLLGHKRAAAGQG